MLKQRGVAQSAGAGVSTAPPGTIIVVDPLPAAGSPAAVFYQSGPFAVAMTVDGSDGGSGGMQARFDYSVPKQRHPNDFSVSTEDMLASGFMTLDAFKAPNGTVVRLRD